MSLLFTSFAVKEVVKGFEKEMVMKNTVPCFKCKMAVAYLRTTLPMSGLVRHTINVLHRSMLMWVCDLEPNPAGTNSFLKADTVLLILQMEGFEALVLVCTELSMLKNPYAPEGIKYPWRRHWGSPCPSLSPSSVLLDMEERLPASCWPLTELPH